MYPKTFLVCAKMDIMDSWVNIHEGVVQVTNKKEEDKLFKLDGRTYVGECDDEFTIQVTEFKLSSLNKLVKRLQGYLSISEKEKDD